MPIFYLSMEKNNLFKVVQKLIEDVKAFNGFSMINQETFEVSGIYEKTLPEYHMVSNDSQLWINFRITEENNLIKLQYKDSYLLWEEKSKMKKLDDKEVEKYILDMRLKISSLCEKYIVKMDG